MSLLGVQKGYEKNVAEKIKTHILRSIIFFSENCVLYETIRGKYGRIKQAIDGDIIRAHALCMLGN